jgi:high-affinity nickel permease
MDTSFGTLLAGWQHAVLLGTWFGLLHAFDADHLATLGGLAVDDRKLSPAGYALRWAAGHGAALGAVAVLALGLNLGGIVEWAAYAELLVCLALFLIGGQVLRAVWRRYRSAARRRADGAALEAHVRGVGVPHVHFFAPFHGHARPGRTSLMMGVLHGGAGSAAVLALLPLAHFRTALDSAIYLACFSIGVALGALAFARVFASFAKLSLERGERIGMAFQAAVGVLALASGGLLFIEIAHGGG